MWYATSLSVIPDLAAELHSARQCSLVPLQDRQGQHLAAAGGQEWWQPLAGRNGGAVQQRCRWTNACCADHVSLSLSLLHPRSADFFISVINLKTGTILGATAVVYLFVFFFFSIWWYLIVR